MKTTMLSAMYTGVAGKVERAYIPIGVAAQLPNSNSPIDRQRTFFQICGKRDTGDYFEHQNHRNNL